MMNKRCKLHFSQSENSIVKKQDACSEFAKASHTHIESSEIESSEIQCLLISK